MAAYTAPKQTLPESKPKKTASKKAPAKAPKKSSGTGGYTRETSIGFKIGTDLNNRMVGALHRIGPQLGTTQKADFIRNAMEFYLDHLEKEHNDGEEFEPILPDS